jgi:hypothetical protein
MSHRACMPVSYYGSFSANCDRSSAWEYRELLPAKQSGAQNPAI